MQTMQQQRAAFALERVKADLNETQNKSEYKSQASALPFMIHANGLGQTAAFYYSKGKGAHRQLYKLLSDWLTKESGVFNHQTDLLKAITETEMETYLLAQAEAMKLMEWVKKFATAYAGEK
jgi:CRISPR-associated protein Cmr5